MGKRWPIVRRLECLVCGSVLEHKPTGRPKTFCGPACRQREYREYPKWALQNMVHRVGGGSEDLPKPWRQGSDALVIVEE